MSQLLSSRKPRGRFGAPPGPGRPWWQTVPTYMALFASVFAFVLTVVQWTQYFACAGSSKPACASAQLLTLESGTYTGLVWVTGGLLAVYLGCAIAAQLTLSRPHVPFIVPFVLVLVGLVCVVLAWLVLGGYVGTPVATLSPDIPIAERIGS
jgi:hypothetical protein